MSQPFDATLKKLVQMYPADWITGLTGWRQKRQERRDETCSRPR